MEERRCEKRNLLLYYTRVFETQTHQQLGNLVDLSSRGAMLITPTAVPTGMDIKLKLELSGDISNKPFIEISAQSLWCHSDIDPALFNSGFKFLNISQENADIVQNIVNTMGFLEN